MVAAGSSSDAMATDLQASNTWRQEEKGEEGRGKGDGASVRTRIRRTYSKSCGVNLQSQQASIERRHERTEIRLHFGCSTRVRLAVFGHPSAHSLSSVPSSPSSPFHLPCVPRSLPPSFSHPRPFCLLHGGDRLRKKSTGCSSGKPEGRAQAGGGRQGGRKGRSVRLSAAHTHAVHPCGQSLCPARTPCPSTSCTPLRRTKNRMTARFPV